MMRLALGAKCVVPRMPGTVVGPAAAKRMPGSSRLASAAAPMPPALRRRNVRRVRAAAKVWRSIMLAFFCSLTKWLGRLARAPAVSTLGRDAQATENCESFSRDGLVHVEYDRCGGGVGGQLAGVEVGVFRGLADGRDFRGGFGVGEVGRQMRVETVEENFQFGVGGLSRN